MAIALGQALDAHPVVHGIVRTRCGSEPHRMRTIRRGSALHRAQLIAPRAPGAHQCPAGSGVRRTAVRGAVVLCSVRGTDPGTEGRQGGTRAAAEEEAWQGRDRGVQASAVGKEEGGRREVGREEGGGEEDGAAAARLGPGRVRRHSPACFKDYDKGTVITKVGENWGHPGCAPRQPSAAEREFERNKARIESGETFRSRKPSDWRRGASVSSTRPAR